MEEDLPSPPLTSHASGPTLRRSSFFFSPQLPLPFLSTTWTGLPFPGGPALTPAPAHSLHSRPPTSGLLACHSYIQLNLFPFCNSKAMHVHVIKKHHLLAPYWRAGDCWVLELERERRHSCCIQGATMNGKDASKDVYHKMSQVVLDVYIGC